MQARRKFKEKIRKRGKIIQRKRKEDRFMYHNKDREREEVEETSEWGKKRCEFKISIYQLI